MSGRPASWRWEPNVGAPYATLRDADGNMIVRLATARDPRTRMALALVPDLEAVARELAGRDPVCNCVPPIACYAIDDEAIARLRTNPVPRYPWMDMRDRCAECRARDLIARLDAASK